MSQQQSPRAQPPEDRLNAFWRKALQAAPEAPINTAKLAAVRATIFSAAQQQPFTQNRSLLAGTWRLLTDWWSGSGAHHAAPPRWATSCASVTLACLVLVLWYQRTPEPVWDSEIASQPLASSAAGATAATGAAGIARHAEVAALQSWPSPSPSQAEAGALADSIPQGKIAAQGWFAPSPEAPAFSQDSANQASAMAGLAEDRVHPPMAPSPAATMRAPSGIAPAPFAVASPITEALHAADAVAWRVNGHSLFAPLNAAQRAPIVTQLEELLAQAPWHPEVQSEHNAPHSPRSWMQRNHLQLLIKQAGQVHLIAHIVAEPSYQIDWFSPSNAWLASTPMDEAAYNRIQSLLAKDSDKTAPAHLGSPASATP